MIKRERTFVSALNREEGRRDRAILIAVTTAARELGISVIAEGVEDTEQLAELHRAGCGYAQGFLFSEPRAAGHTAPRGTSAVVIRGVTENSRPPDRVLVRALDAGQHPHQHRLRSNA